MKDLIAIQNELKAPKNQYNSFGKYKYRNQEDILEAVKPLLKKYKCELFITDEIKQVGEIIYTEATAVFSDSNMNHVRASAQAGINPNKKGMDISQSFGSSSSYARKYALNGLFLIDDTKDADSEQPPKKKKLTAEIAKDYAKRGTTVEHLAQNFELTEVQKNKYIKLLEDAK